jgi:hypothetical protein
MYAQRTLDGGDETTDDQILGRISDLGKTEQEGHGQRGSYGQGTSSSNVGCVK